MDMAWNVSSVDPTSIPRYLANIASQYFDNELNSETVAIWHEYDRLVRMRKHEHIDPESFSLLHYNEADDIVARWKKLEVEVDTLYNRVPDLQKPSFWQLVVHPVKASTIFICLRVTQARNQLYARQRRNTANNLLRKALDLFDADFKLSQEFHTLLDGKWNHMLCQPHMGYGDTWHAPSRDAIFGLAYVQRSQNSNIIVGQMGVAVEGHEGIRAGRINEESERTHPSRRDLVPGLTLGSMSRYGPVKLWFDVFTRGAQIIHWKASAPHSWVQLSTTAGTLHPDGEDARVLISIDWDQVPVDFDEELLINVMSEEGDFEHVHLPVKGQKAPLSFSGFIEADGCVSIPASASASNLSPFYQHHPDLGRRSEGAVSLVDDIGHESSDLPFLEYSVFLFSSYPSPSITLYFNMTLDVDPAHPMSYELGIDTWPTGSHRLLSADGDKKTKLPAEGWTEAVMDCVWEKTHSVSNMEAGVHTIRIRLCHPNLPLERVVVDLGGVKQSYLGPPSSYRAVG